VLARLIDRGAIKRLQIICRGIPGQARVPKPRSACSATSHSAQRLGCT